MGAIVIRTRYDEGTESAEVATSDTNFYQLPDERISISSLGRPNCVLHAHVAVELSVLAISNNSEHRKMRAKQQHVCKEMNQYMINLCQPEIDSKLRHRMGNRSEV